MSYKLVILANGIRYTVGFDSLDLASKAQSRALATGASAVIYLS